MKMITRGDEPETHKRLQEEKYATGKREILQAQINNPAHGNTSNKTIRYHGVNAKMTPHLWTDATTFRRSEALNFVQWKFE